MFLFSKIYPELPCIENLLFQLKILCGLQGKVTENIKNFKVINY